MQRVLLALVLSALLVVTSCSLGSDRGSGDASASAATDAGSVELWDASTVHAIEVTFDEADYDGLVDDYTENGEKTWIEATVTVDGTTYERAGLRLKGNSTLRGLARTASDAGADTATGSSSKTTAPDPATSDGADNTTERTTENTTGTSTGASTAGSAAEATRSGTGETTTSTADETTSTPPGAATRPDDGGFPGGGFGTNADAEQPEALPWLIRLDKFVDGQLHQGYADIVIRASNSTTALNEAVALDLLDAAGLASQQAVSAGFSVNGSDPTLRLAIEHPSDDAWQDRNFDGSGALYKAESGGAWSYRGDDPDAYTDVFDQEGGAKTADLTPLTDFLEFLDGSDDEAFATELPDQLDVEAFADYLALMELVQNTDDIDGPGNNAYLWWDERTGAMTVAAWDLNLAFGGMGGPGGAGAPPEGFDPQTADGTDRPVPPEGFDPQNLPEGADVPAPPGAGAELPQGAEAPTGGFRGPGGGGGPGGQENPLVTRFLENSEFEALFDERLDHWRQTLFADGRALDLLEARVSVLESVPDLVDADTLADEADRIRTAIGRTTEG